MMNYLFSLFRVKSLKLFVIFSACNLLIPSAWAEDACGVVTTACPTLNIPYSPQEGVVGTIGNGFDSDRDRYKPMRCLNGTETTVGGGTSTLSASKISSFEELLERLTITVDTKVKFVVFSAESHVKFVNEVIQKAFSQSFTFAYDIKLNNASFNIDPNNPLNDAGKSALVNQCRFREICGDQFVYQIERGASLYVNLQFQFSSDYHKREFDLKAKAGVDGAISKCGSSLPFSFDVETSINKLNESTRKNGSMKLTAMQIGGNVEQLARIFGTSGNVPSISCSLDDLTSCSKALDEIVKYAASTDFSTGVRQYPANLKYHYGNYWEVSSLVPRANAEVTPEIENARTDLAREYAKRLSDLDRMDALLRTYTLSSIHQQQLVVLKDSLIKDIPNLREAANICYSDLSNCLAKKCQVFNALANYTDDIFNVGIHEGMVVYYPLDSNMKDATGNGNDARPAAGSVTATQGQMGNAYRTGLKSLKEGYYSIFDGIGSG